MKHSLVGNVISSLLLNIHLNFEVKKLHKSINRQGTETCDTKQVCKIFYTVHFIIGVGKRRQT
jgi:hypothetical protein